MFCPNQFIPTPKLKFSTTMKIDSKSFDFCSNCQRFHPSQILHQTQKTQKTQSFKVQDSNIFDMNTKLAHLLKLSSHFDQPYRSYPQREQIQRRTPNQEQTPRGDWFSTASNSKKHETPTSCSSPKRFKSKNIRLKPKHLNRRNSQILFS